MDNSENLPVVNLSADLMVGIRVREIRKQKKLTLRSLAGLTGLNINTLSLIENARISPSVSTLQRLAQALGVAISSFFDEEKASRPVIVTRNSERTAIPVEGVLLENLIDNSNQEGYQIYQITLAPGYSSGDKSIRHEGFEFVYCQAGRINYLIDNEKYELFAGDSLMFDSHLPHSWQNQELQNSKFLLMILPVCQDKANQYDHFLNRRN